MFGIFKRKEFNLGEYLIQLGYDKQQKIINCDSYSNGIYEINIFRKEVVGYNMVVINFDEHNLVTLRFVPNSQIMVDMILAKIQTELDNNDTFQKTL